MGSSVATTQWSQIVAARDGSTSEAREAMEFLCQTYWQPVYAYIRRRGSDPETARDLTQAYFTELLDKNFLVDVDRSKGRFRAFLFASLRHFLAHERDRDQALKRGGGVATISLSVAAGEAGYAPAVAEAMSPESLFEYRWAMTVLDRALARLEQEAAAAGTLDRFEQLRPYLTSADSSEPYRQTAATLGVSESAIRSAVRRLRLQLGQCLRAEIAVTVAEPSEVDDEVRSLLRKIQYQSG